MNVQLLVIDPQNDFCKSTGSLFVPGADEDMKRLTAMVTRIKDKITGINVTLDSHRTIDVAHPAFWVGSDGKHPAPFTLITTDDVDNGIWRATQMQHQKKALAYVHALKDSGRYVLCIWPPHCIIGSEGHAIVPELSDALIDWETSKFRNVNYVTKGSNPFTEHYSAVIADVPDPEDVTTMLNTDLLDVCSVADIVITTGEALSHCVANTATDIADNFGEDNIRKICLITDTCSNVPGFEQLGEDFIKDMVKRGMQTATSVELFA